MVERLKQLKKDNPRSMGILSLHLLPFRNPAFSFASYLLIIITKLAVIARN